MSGTDPSAGARVARAQGLFNDEKRGPAKAGPL